MSSWRSAPRKAATTRKSSSASNWESTRSARCGGVFDLTLIEAQPGFALMVVRGNGAEEAFAEEAGGHRWQRVPPNDKRGRVHTSTITVAVLPESGDPSVRIHPADLEWRVSRGSGAGGQKRNKTESAVDLVHLPTGISVHCENERSLQQNRAIALARLSARVAERARSIAEGARARERRAQLGSGMRGDKRRTIRCQDGVVVDHPTGRTWRLRDYLRGE